jgi:hypothetical protein
MQTVQGLEASAGAPPVQHLPPFMTGGGHLLTSGCPRGSDEQLRTIPSDFHLVAMERR